MLVKGRRHRPGGSSPARLLQAARGACNLADLPPLAPGEILAWADARFVCTGRRPTVRACPRGPAPHAAAGRQKGEAQHGAREEE
jgi:hypothetical protein